jgi:TetR/AcrR family transcriptional regulator, transcriptional repressor of aconitase
MPKVSQSYRDARRLEILDAAMVCFSRQGFHRTSMQDIVKESNLSPGAIYNYFKSKDDIIVAIANDRRAVERVLLSEARKQPNVVAVLTRLRDVFFGELPGPKERRRRRLSVQLWAEAQRNPKIRKIVRRGMSSARHLLRAIISEARRKGEISKQIDPDAAARFMIASFQGFVLQTELDDPVQLRTYAKLLDTFLKSLIPMKKTKR